MFSFLRALGNSIPPLNPSIISFNQDRNKKDISWQHQISLSKLASIHIVIPCALYTTKLVARVRVVTHSLILIQDIILHSHLVLYLLCTPIVLLAYFFHHLSNIIIRISSYHIYKMWDGTKGQNCGQYCMTTTKCGKVMYVIL